MEIIIKNGRYGSTTQSKVEPPGNSVRCPVIASERVFSDPANSPINGVTKAVSYGYNLAGQLKSVTDPAGLQVNYSYGRAGQLTRVEGSAAYGGVTTYASGMEYRAWGALKAVGYGNGLTLSLSYNSRLQLESYQLPGVIDTQYRYTTTPTSGDNDGRVKFAQDLTQANSPFDRAYRYDHVGRLTEALTGSEARGGPQATVPYYESLGYDVWGNLIARNGRNWSQTIDGYSTTFVNGRGPGSDYDADGRTVRARDLTTTYDAAGRAVKAQNQTPRTRFQTGLTVEHGYGGHGGRVKHKENNATTYYVRSSVLGQVVAELNSTGGWKRGYVYAGGRLLATRDAGLFGNAPKVECMHTDPVTGNQRRPDAAGAYTGGVEVGPLGADVGFEDPSGSDATGGNFAGARAGCWCRRATPTPTTGGPGAPSTGCPRPAT